MSRAFYIPPQTQNNNSVGNHRELVNILVATLLSLLERRHRCTRRCCARISQHGSAYVSHREHSSALTKCWLIILLIFSTVKQSRTSINLFGIIWSSYKAPFPTHRCVEVTEMWDFCTKQNKLNLVKLS